MRLNSYLKLFFFVCVIKTLIFHDCGRGIAHHVTGARGSGKSSTGNTILRRNAFNSDMQLSRVTQFCERASGNINGRPVAIIDTPGLNRIGRTERKVTREILKSISLYTPGPHVFLLVMPVGNLTDDDKSMHKLIESMFGESFLEVHHHRVHSWRSSGGKGAKWRHCVLRHGAPQFHP